MPIPPELRASLQTSPDDMQTFARVWREQHELLSALPERFTAALENILQRLESGAAFAEESCSFSQRDLLDGLATWLDRAEQIMQ
jgi:selenocysteine lyase/cysteine desulfurase